MSKHAIIAVEARGAAIHLGEDANVNLLQAGFLARELVERGWSTSIRLIADAGQSIEEYSVICHLADDERDGLQSSMALSKSKPATRRRVVAELRERYVPIQVDAVQPFDTPVEDRILFSALLARITGVNELVMSRIREIRHPLLDPDRVHEYEQLLHMHVGRMYLDLEESLARCSIGTFLADLAEAVPIDVISRPPQCPQNWLCDPICERIIHADLADKRTGSGINGFRSRLIGLFTTVHDPEEERSYFNSPTCCRYEHGKVRVIARDRFDILMLRSSERMTFDIFLGLLEAQNAGNWARPMALKYPYTAYHLAATLAEQALQLAGDGETKVIFVEGIDGAINAGTAGIIDAQLHQQLDDSPVSYHRVCALQGSRQMLPYSPGGLTLIAPRLAMRVAETFAAGSLCALEPERHLI